MNCHFVDISPHRSIRHIYKRRKRKRFRNRRKELYDLPSGSKGNFKSTMRTFEEKLIPSWFWSNYYKAMEWQNRHKVAVWKSYALALQQENKYLLRELRKLVPDRSFDVPMTTGNLQNPVRKTRRRFQSKDEEKIPKLKAEHSLEHEHEDNRDEEVEFEMSEEMIKFFEQSFRHKLEMRKLKELELERLDSDIKELKEAHLQREKEMKLLYGEGSSKIVGMETAVQLSYDKYCDMKSPNYWPNIPLNL